MVAIHQTISATDIVVKEIITEDQQQLTAGPSVQWRWRELNLRPKESTSELYERSLPKFVITGISAGR